MNKKIVISVIAFLIVLLISVTIFLLNYSAQNKTITKTATSQTPSISLPDLTIEKVFSEDHSWWKKIPQEHIRILTATGDIIPARSVNAGATKRNNPLWPYEKVAPTLTSLPSDIVFINLETPLIPNCPVTVEGMVFCGAPRNIEGIKSIGTTVANLANNHAGNHGETGVKETYNLLKDNGITPVGIDGPTYKEIRGLRFAFLGYNDITKDQPGVSNANETKIAKEIKTARQNADIVVVTYHWGVEYRDQPDERQIELGHLTIDSGADIVIGNHPHWIQPIEFYKGKLITYAHGNFVFDQMWSQKTKEGVVGRYVFYDNTLIDVEYLPLFIEDYGQARFADGEDKKRILSEMKKQSLILSKEKAI